MIRTIKLHDSFLMLIILSVLTTGCAGKKNPIETEAGAFEALRANVQEVVTDPARTERSLVLVDELQRVFDDMKKMRAERRQRIRTLNADYDAPRADFDALFDHIAEERITNQQRASQVYGEFRAAVTTKEWAGLAKTSSQTMKAAVAAFQSI